MQRFEESHLKTHNGRELAWQTNMGHGEVRAGGFANGKKHDLILRSALQIPVLMLFSAQEVETLADGTSWLLRRRPLKVKCN